MPFYRQFTPPLVASISADTVEQFGELAARISVPGVKAIEANISCPNLKKDGNAFAMDPEATEQVIRAMKGATALPVWAKLTPNVGDITVLARAAEAGGAMPWWWPMPCSPWPSTFIRAAPGWAESWGD